MSDAFNNMLGGLGNAAGGGLPDVISQLKNIVTNLSNLSQALSTAIPRVSGTFTLSAATTTVVVQPLISTNAVIEQPMPLNATAALILRTNGLFVSVSTAGVGFSLSTQAGSAVAGGVFSYTIVNLV